MKNLQFYINSSLLTAILLIMIGCSTDEKRVATVAKIDTNQGVIEFVLLDETPLHKHNFMKMAADSFYNKILFHRVINGFVVQAGEQNTRNLAEGAPYEDSDGEHVVKAEILPQFYHVRGAVAAARIGNNENPERNSSGTHFYIIHGTNQEQIADAIKNLSGKLPSDIETSYKTTGGVPRLDGEYTIFGYVVEGMDVVDKIEGFATDEKDRPLNNVIINRVDITEQPLSKYKEKEIYKLFNRENK